LICHPPRREHFNALLLALGRLVSHGQAQYISVRVKAVLLVFIGLLD
jgi:hypothetical protein